jgi:3-oxoacyl-[acyl-carrier-protein] synthase III
MNIRIIGSGSHIPPVTITNADFVNHEFLSETGIKLNQPPEVIIRKFTEITGIEERRYADPAHQTSDLAFAAAQLAIADAGIDPETLDYIILAHNFGDIKSGTIQSDAVPSLASRVKQKLKIKNPKCVAYDLLFGCPGWIEGMLHANAFIKSGMAKRCLVIGAETLSRVIDMHDRDSMIYSDGSGATVVEACDSSRGILAHESATFATDEAEYLFFGRSYHNDHSADVRYIKMLGRKIYEFALIHVPQAMKECLDKSGESIEDVKKILIHQANEKMDEAIVSRFYKLYEKEVPQGVMPMSIHKLGNSSVATIPTLYDLMVNHQLPGQQLNEGDLVIFASVGAGMNINAFVYRY